MDEDKKSCSIAIGIATAKRRDVLSETLKYMSLQVRQPDEVVICPATNDDADEAKIKEYFPLAKIVSGKMGLPSQRNTIMNSTRADIVAFFDDDFLPARDYLKEVELLFSGAADIVVATGHVIADGIAGPGLSFSEGAERLHQISENTGGEPRETYGGYGCNMIIRRDAAEKYNVRFDEKLPLYAWQEDIDFSRQMAAHGRVVNCPRLRGVHLGTKRAGRGPGDQLGYSQVANPVYMVRKGTMSWQYATKLISNNILSNIGKSLFPEHWVDRRGRLKGNVIAIRDWLTGRLDPENVLNM